MTEKKKRNVILAVVFCLLCFGLVYCLLTNEKTHDGTKDKNNGCLVSHYIDVGEGDCELVELPDGKCLLIDAGTSDCGEKIVKYISSLGYKSIDYVILSHPHSDHIGGMPNVLKNFEVGIIYMPDTTGISPEYVDMAQLIKKKQIPTEVAKRGVKVCDGDGYSVDIIAPCSKSYDNENNYSAVVMIKFGETSFLYMGDAEKESENEIGGNIEADVIKIGHHGSKTSSSSDFLKRVNPEYAVIPCGKDNDNGHPDEGVLTVLNALGTEIYRTDRHGNVVIVSDGKRIEKISTDKKD